MPEFFKSLLQKLGEFASTAGIKLIGAFVIVFVGFRLCKWLLKLIQKGKGFHRLDTGVQTFLISFLNIVLKTLILLTAASVLGVPMTNFVAVLGSAGLAIGLALQGALANFAGGIMILIFKPFEVGDFIESAGVSGTVRSISILYTTLLTPDNRRIVIPNGTLSNATVVDYSSESSRRVELIFSVSYDSDIETVKQTLLDTASAHPLVLKDPAPFARLSKQNDSSLDFVLRVWCQSGDYWTVNFDLNEEVKKVFDQKGIEIPFPQMDVHLDRDGEVNR